MRKVLATIVLALGAVCASCRSDYNSYSGIIKYSENKIVSQYFPRTQLDKNKKPDLVSIVNDGINIELNYKSLTKNDNYFFSDGNKINLGHYERATGNTELWDYDFDGDIDIKTPTHILYNDGYGNFSFDLDGKKPIEYGRYPAHIGKSRNFIDTKLDKNIRPDLVRVIGNKISVELNYTSLSGWRYDFISDGKKISLGHYKDAWWDIQLRDYDKDGDYDILTPTHILENDGNAHFTPKIRSK